MRIALVSGEYPPQPGGVGDYTRRLAGSLVQRGHVVTVLTIQDRRLRAYRNGDLTAPLPWRSSTDLDWSPRCWPALIGVLDHLRPHWLHIQYQTGAYAMRPGINLLPWRLRALPGRPRIAVTFHDLLAPYLFPKAGPLRRWVNWRLARDADVAITTTAADAALLREAGVESRMIPIGSNIPVAPPEGFERAAWRARLGLGAADRLVAYFGLLAPSKGADVLLEALARLDPFWRLIIIGGAATAPQDVAHAEAVRALAARLGLASRVTETGHLPDEEVSAWLLAADLVVLPFRDGASFRRGSLLAALAHGCPVVSTTPADAATLEALRPAALLAPPDDPAALAAAMAALAADAAARARLAAAGRALAARFSWSAIAVQHEALYEECSRVG
ncbi:MAG: glycosyltransferase [Oscillochloridaceae bacterium]|nr:glycosyltransferase [Chloroflexaceae bacterium]MDW8389253.1 glycosyltransferase [Oscillochloridaceae bacterium]